MLRLLSCAVGVFVVVLGLPVEPRFSSATMLSKADQQPGWHPVKHAQLAARGFTKWKATPAGFLLKNSDFMVACRGHISDMNVQCSAPMPEAAAAFIQQAAKLSKSTETAAKGKVAFKAGRKYTPLMNKELKPLKPELQYENERGVNIDDAVNEGEQDNSDLNPESESESDIRKQRRFFDHVDVGPGNSIDEENERDTQHKTVIRKESIRKNKAPARKALVDVPYVDAGVERVVNEHMFSFFKKHPQYHTIKAHWLTAKRWREWMLMSGDESNKIGLYGNGKEPEGVESGLMGPEGNAMWKRCPENIPEKWPATPHIQCEHFAVSPVGFWGCNSLFEDGTCTKTQFYDNIRWDGLDAYPLPQGESDADAQQYKNPNAYTNEILPGGNPI